MRWYTCSGPSSNYTIYMINKYFNYSNTCWKAKVSYFYVVNLFIIDMIIFMYGRGQADDVVRGHAKVMLHPPFSRSKISYVILYYFSHMANSMAPTVIMIPLNKFYFYFYFLARILSTKLRHHHRGLQLPIHCFFF